VIYKKIVIAACISGLLIVSGYFYFREKAIDRLDYELNTALNESSVSSYTVISSSYNISIFDAAAAYQIEIDGSDRNELIAGEKWENADASDSEYYKSLISDLKPLGDVSSIRVMRFAGQGDRSANLVMIYGKTSFIYIMLSTT